METMMIIVEVVCFIAIVVFSILFLMGKINEMRYNDAVNKAKMLCKSMEEDFGKGDGETKYNMVFNELSEMLPKLTDVMKKNLIKSSVAELRVEGIKDKK